MPCEDVALGQLGEHPSPAHDDGRGGGEPSGVLSHAGQTDEPSAEVDLSEAVLLELNQGGPDGGDLEPDVLGQRTGAGPDDARHLAGELADEEVQVDHAGGE